MSPDEMPATFSYGGLTPKDAHYRQGTDPRSGVEARQVIMGNHGELARIVVISIGSDRIFAPVAFRQRLDGLLGDQQVEWHETSQTSGIAPTKLVTFSLPGKGAECVGFERSLRAHPEAATPAYSQALAFGFYCRASGAFSTQEAQKVAAALRTNS